MSKFSFFIPVLPASLQKSGSNIAIRPVKGQPGKFKPQFYADTGAKNFKSMIAVECKKYVPAQPLTGPLHLSIVFIVPRPGRLNRKKDPAGRIWCEVKPDNINMTKGFEDCLTKAGFWHDDKQVAKHSLEKWHAAKENDACGMEVVIETLAPPDPSGVIAYSYEVTLAQAPLFALE